MNKNQIVKFTGNKEMTIVDAMEKIDSNAKGVLFILDDEERLAGCVTDGDIRRCLIKTGNLHEYVENAMTCFPKYLFQEERSRAESVMQQEKITALPILSKNLRIVDLVFANETKITGYSNGERMLSNVPVVIMAGGKGTRLYPFTKILPKPLIPIGETPIMERIINCFLEYGIEKYYVTVNYKKGMIKSYFSDLNPSYEVQFVEEDKPLGTGGSLKLIHEKFERSLFVTNCDSLIFADYHDIYNYHIRSDNDITIVSSLKNITVPYGVLHLKEDGELADMEEKPKLSYFVNTGMYVIKPETIEKIPTNTLFHMTHLVDTVRKDGGKVGVYPISEDSFLDMGEFNEKKRMEEKLHISEV